MSGIQFNHLALVGHLGTWAVKAASLMCILKIRVIIGLTATALHLQQMHKFCTLPSAAPRTCPSTRGLASPFCASCLSCAPWQRCGCEHGLLQRVQQHLYHASCRRHLHQLCHCSIALCEHVHTWLRLLPSWSECCSLWIEVLCAAVQQPQLHNKPTPYHLQKEGVSPLA